MTDKYLIRRGCLCLRARLRVKTCNPECCYHCLTGYLPATLTLHTYFNSLNSRLGDLGHLGLGDGRLVLIQ